MLRVTLRSFAKSRHAVPLDAVSIADIEKWLDTGGWAPRTRKGYLIDVGTLYNWAIRRGLVKWNPAKAIEAPVVEEPPPCIQTPDQVRTVLEFARTMDVNLCRSLAIRYFAGIRACEANRLIEEEIKLSQNYVEITATKAKTRRRRLSRIQPNLAAWLALGGELPIRDTHTRFSKFTHALKKATGIEWSKNTARHTYCSYHLAMFENAGKTALEAGHAEAMLFSTYREVVTHEAAVEYFSIVPKKNPATL
jgi:integrase